MEILSTISSLLGITEIFMSLRDKFKNSNNKDDVIIWLKELADLIEQIAKDLEQNIYPHGKCSQLQFYLKMFFDMVKLDLPKNQKDDLYNLISDAYQVEKLCGQLNNLSDTEKQKNLIKMLESAGVLRAMSDLIKLSK